MSLESRRDWLGWALGGAESRSKKSSRRLLVESLETRNLLTLAIPQLAAADDSGALGDYITNVNQPHLVGSATAGDTVEITSFGGGKVLGQAAVSPDGSFSVQYSNPIADGTNVYRIQELDPSGNAADSSSAFTLQIKTSIPAGPYQPLLLPSDQSGPSTTTANPRPTFYGETEAWGTVELLDAGGNVLASTQASILDGTFTIQPANNLPAGLNKLHFETHDRAGNWGPAGATAGITVLANAPVPLPTPPASPDPTPTPGAPTLTGNPSPTPAPTPTPVIWVGSGPSTATTTGSVTPTYPAPTTTQASTFTSQTPVATYSITKHAQVAPHATHHKLAPVKHAVKHPVATSAHKHH